MARSRKVVTAHLEKVSGKVLAEYSSEIRALIKGKSGIYALYNNDSLYYVGLASNLMSRLKNHLRDRHQGEWDYFSVYLTVHDEHMKELESLILRTFNPEGNIQTGKFIQSADLKSDLMKAVEESDAKKRAKLIGGKTSKRFTKHRPGRVATTSDLATIFGRRTTLRGWCKRYQHTAYLNKDGTISYGSKKFKSLSSAGKAARKCATNGWVFWHVRNSDGEWVRLRTLRR